MTNEEKFKKVVTEVRDFLKPLGFKKTGTRFYRKTENIFAIVEFQKNKWNDEASLGFTLNLGIASSTLIKLLDGISYFKVPKVPTSADCQERYRIGSFSQTTRDIWWTITDKTEESQVVEEILALLQEAVPYISEVENDIEFCDFLIEKESKAEEPYLPRCRAILTLLTHLERGAEAREARKELLEKFPKKNHKDLFERLDSLQNV